MKQHAEEYDVTISEKEQKAITKAAKAFMKENDEATLEEMCATQEIVEEYLTYQTYAYKVEEAVKAAAKVSVKDEDAAQKTISYVCFSTEAVTDETGNTVELTEEELKQIKEDAKTLAQTEDFDATAEALEQKVQTAHYGKKDETLADAVKEAADALAEGEISSVVEVEGTGYYVIRLDAAFDEEATAEEKASLEEEQRSAYFTDKMEEWKKEMDWKVDKKQWKKVTFDSLFQAPQTQND